VRREDQLLCLLLERQPMNSVRFGRRGYRAVTRSSLSLEDGLDLRLDAAVHAAQRTFLRPLRRLSFVLVLGWLEPVNCETLHGWQRSFALHRIDIDSCHATEPIPIKVSRWSAMPTPGLAYIQATAAFPEHIDDASIWNVLFKPFVEETTLAFGATASDMPGFLFGDGIGKFSPGQLGGQRRRRYRLKILDCSLQLLRAEGGWGSWASFPDDMQEPV